MKTLEAKLTALVDRVAPAELRIRYIETPAALLKALPGLRKSKTYSVSFQTRSFDEGSVSSSVRSAIEMTLDGLERGPKDVDPVVPSWYALSRMQREIVEQSLKRMAAEHKQRGATLNLATSPDAQVELEIADAFDAALRCLEFEYENEKGTAWEPLAARLGPATRKPTDPVDDGDDKLNSRKGRKRAFAAPQAAKKGGGPKAANKQSEKSK